MAQFTGYVYSLSITVGAGETILVTNNGGGPTVVTLTAGTYSPITLAAMLQTVLTAQRAPSAGAWSVSVSLVTGQVTIAMSAGTFSITWTSTNLRSILGFVANIVAAASSTSPGQAKGMWFPDSVLVSDVDLRRAIQNTHRRVTVAPTGRTSSARGPGRYEHSGLRWDLVASNRVWTAEESTVLVNAAYETFLKDALLNQGHAWFPYDGRVAIVDHRGITAGQDAPLTGWQVADLPELTTLRMVHNGYTGLLAITWPLITSDG